MIFAILNTIAIVCILRLAIAWLVEIDEHGNIKVNAWYAAVILSGILFNILKGYPE